MSKVSSKKELAEAGRRKLEAFRKQKAADKKAKKAPAAYALPGPGSAIPQSSNAAPGSTAPRFKAQASPIGTAAADEDRPWTNADSEGNASSTGRGQTVAQQQDGTASSSGPIPFRATPLPNGSLPPELASAAPSLGHYDNSRGSLDAQQALPANAKAEPGGGPEQSSAANFVPAKPITLGPSSEGKLKLPLPPPLAFKRPPALPQAGATAPGRVSFPLPAPLKFSAPPWQTAQGSQAQQSAVPEPVATEPASPTNALPSVETADSLPEELPISSPEPSAYASLSDSYLSPSKGKSIEGDQAAEPEAAVPAASIKHQQQPPEDNLSKDLSDLSPGAGANAYAALSDSYLSPSPEKEGLPVANTPVMDGVGVSSAAEGRGADFSDSGVAPASDFAAGDRVPEQPAAAKTLDFWQPAVGDSKAAYSGNGGLEASHRRGFGSWSLSSGAADGESAAASSQVKGSESRMNGGTERKPWPWIADSLASALQGGNLDPDADDVNSHDQPSTSGRTDAHWRGGSQGRGYAHTGSGATGVNLQNGAMARPASNGRSSFPWDPPQAADVPLQRRSSLDFGGVPSMDKAQANGWAGNAGDNGSQKKAMWVPNGLTSPPSFADLLPDARSKDADQFATLQQYIDDLTREKFEMSRGLEQQRRVAETLAIENQALTEDYNRQAQLVQELRREMEQRAAEIGAQQMALAGVGGERDACRSAVAEATQRAEALAAEVVALEEKVLQAKSAELRAAKQAEADSLAARRAAQSHASAAAECANLRTMVAALQEEKKKWPEQLRLVSVGAPSKLHSGDAWPSTHPDPAALVEPEASRPSNNVQQGAEISRLAERARQHVAAQSYTPSAAPGDLPPVLAHLLPARTYKGGASGEAAEAVAEQRRVLGSICSLLSALEEKQRLQVPDPHSSLPPGKAVESTAGKTSGYAGANLLEIPPDSESEGRPVMQSAPTTPAQQRRPLRAPQGSTRRGPFRWLAGLIAPPPPSKPDYNLF